MKRPAPLGVQEVRPYEGGKSTPGDWTLGTARRPRPAQRLRGTRVGSLSAPLESLGGPRSGRVCAPAVTRVDEDADNEEPITARGIHDQTSFRKTGAWCRNSSIWDAGLYAAAIRPGV